MRRVLIRTQDNAAPCASKNGDAAGALEQTGDGQLQSPGVNGACCYTVIRQARGGGDPIQDARRRLAEADAQLLQAAMRALRARANDIMCSCETIQGGGETGGAGGVIQLHTRVPLHQLPLVFIRGRGIQSGVGNH